MDLVIFLILVVAVRILRRGNMWKNLLSPTQIQNISGQLNTIKNFAKEVVSDTSFIDDEKNSDGESYIDEEDDLGVNISKQIAYEDHNEIEKLNKKVSKEILY